MVEEEIDEILLRIPASMVKEVDKIAEKERRSRTGQLIVLIEKALEVSK